MYLYNTLSRSIEEFKPIDPSNVRMYTCGPTVYREVHIGNLRTYITADILKRVLRLNGFYTTYVMNITDVGHMRATSESSENQIDPILEEAKSRNMPPLDLAKYYTDLFLQDAKKVAIEPADTYVKATANI